MSDTFRVSKLLSERNICSRREADGFIEKGWVLVDGEVAVLGQRAPRTAKIELTADAQKTLGQHFTILLNKPVGIVSNLPEKKYKEARELLVPNNQYEKDSSKIDPRKLDGLAVAGRLDIDSQGLLVFTQNGAIAKKLIGQDSQIEKEYLVRLQTPPSPETIKKLNGEIHMDGKRLKPAKVTKLNEDQLKFILKEGRKRQIRRMCEQFDLKVTGLKRVRVGKVMLSDLPEGQWRVLGPEEAF